jgi:hypothetical protein
LKLAPSVPCVIFKCARKGLSILLRSTAKVLYFLSEHKPIASIPEGSEEDNPTQSKVANEISGKRIGLDPHKSMYRSSLTMPKKE